MKLRKIALMHTLTLICNLHSMKSDDRIPTFQAQRVLGRFTPRITSGSLTGLLLREFRRSDIAQFIEGAPQQEDQNDTEAATALDLIRRKLSLDLMLGRTENQHLRTSALFLLLQDANTDLSTAKDNQHWLMKRLDTTLEEYRKVALAHYLQADQSTLAAQQEIVDGTQGASPNDLSILMVAHKRLQELREQSNFRQEIESSPEEVEHQSALQALATTIHSRIRETGVFTQFAEKYAQAKELIESARIVAEEKPTPTPNADVKKKKKKKKVDEPDPETVIRVQALQAAETKCYTSIAILLDAWRLWESHTVAHLAKTALDISSTIVALISDLEKKPTMPSNIRMEAYAEYRTHIEDELQKMQQDNKAKIERLLLPPANIMGDEASSERGSSRKD